MIYLFLIYFLFLILWFVASYFVARQLKTYGFVGDASRRTTRIYFILSAIIILASIIIILSV
jgi:hypothetical protein